MYDNAELDLEGILDEIRPNDDNNEADALSIANEKALDDLTEEQVRQLSQAVARDVFHKKNVLSASLLEALSQGHAAFAKKLLEIHVQLSEVSQVTINEETPSFAEVAAKAVQSYLPEILKKVELAGKTAKLNGKQVLVMVGEKHDDPYSKLFESVLLGVLKLQNLFIESTPELVKEHVEPFQKKEPDAPDKDEIGLRQRFYRYLYEQGATITGVDIDKASAKQQVEDELGPRPPEKDPGLPEWKAKLMEQSVVLRNLGIVKALTQKPAPGVLIVGATHLPGLAKDSELAKAYEIVAISTLVPEEVSDRDIFAFGRELSVTSELKEMDGLSIASDENLPSFGAGEVSSSELFKLAEKLVIEINDV